MAPKTETRYSRLECNVYLLFSFVGIYSLISSSSYVLHFLNFTLVHFGSSPKLLIRCKALIPLYCMNSPQVMYMLFSLFCPCFLSRSMSPLSIVSSYTKFYYFVCLYSLPILLHTPDQTSLFALERFTLLQGRHLIRYSVMAYPFYG